MIIMKRSFTILITALFASAAIAMTACSGDGNESSSGGGLFGGASNGTAISDANSGASTVQSNPFGQTSQTQPVPAESTVQPSYTPQPSAVMPSATERSIREVLDSIGGTSALQQSLQSNVSSYANAQVSYNGDDQIIVNLVLNQAVDINSAEGQQFLSSFRNEMPASVAPTITQIRQSTGARPFTFLMVVSNPDGTVIDQMVVSEQTGSQTQTSYDIIDEPSYYYDPSYYIDDDDDEPSFYEPIYQASAVMPSATERSIKEVLDTIGGTSALQQSVQSSVGSDANVQISYNGDDQIVLNLILNQTVDPNTSDGQQFISGFRSGIPSSISSTITQIRQTTGARPFTFLIVVSNPDGTTIDQIVVSEN